MPNTANERWIIGVIFAVQLVNIIDFTMVMPLGPDFTAALNVDPSDLGLVAGAYTLAAAIAAVAGFYLLDRFPRRPALVWAMLGLALGTVGGALATDLYSLLAARALAGLFGGPATAIAMSIVIDTVPSERRGRAMGTVMGAFSIAAVAGVPVSLELSTWFGWRAPFVVVGAACALLAMVACRALPALDGHLGERYGKPSMLASLGRLRIQVALLMTASAMTSAFLLFPQISPWVQFNLGFPREQLSLIYLSAGAVGFVALRLSGRATDRYGPERIGTLTSLLAMCMVGVAFVWGPPTSWVVPVFVLFLVTVTVRNASMVTSLTNVPEEHERAGFMSLNSAVQSLASAFGGWLGASLLHSDAETQALQGMLPVALLAAGLMLVLPLCQRWLGRERATLSRAADDTP